MNARNNIAVTASILSLAAAATTPAKAVETEFATFSALSPYNVYYKNPSRTGTTTSATFYTIASPTSKVAAPVDVSFSFINEGATLDTAVSGVDALFTLSGSTIGPAQVDSFSHNLEEYTQATFSYVTKSAIKIGAKTYAAGSTLLSGTYSNGVLSGKNSTGGIVADNDTTYGPDTLTFASDFVTFQPTASLGMSYTLASISPSPLATAKAGTYALKTFETDVGGQFTADPAPQVNAIPEPASWTLMMVGFGISGASIRRRARVQVAA